MTSAVLPRLPGWTLFLAIAISLGQWRVNLSKSTAVLESFHVIQYRHREESVVPASLPATPAAWLILEGMGHRRGETVSKLLNWMQSYHEIPSP